MNNKPDGGPAFPREFFFIAGTGKQPAGFDNYARVNGRSMDKLIGIKGAIRLHLFGEWETLITPAELRRLLINWRLNQKEPVITISL